MRWLLVTVLLLASCGEETPASSAPAEAPAEPEPEAAAPAEAEEELPVSTQTPEEIERDGLVPRWEAGADVEARLLARPEVLILNDRPHFRLQLTLANRSGAELDELPLSEQFFVNGRRDPALVEALTSGPRGGEWEDVEPGDSGTLIREIGETLFPEPGAYVLTYEHGSARAETRVIVTANAPEDRGVSWWLEATRPRPTMAERAETRLRLSARNDGTEAARPELAAGTWTVNGEPAPGLALAFSNGIQEPGWASLNPQETVSTERSIESLLEAPGVYEIRFAREDVADAGVRITVRPE